MIKARAGNVLFFGLSRGNCDRLLKGQPIRIDGAALGMPGLVVVISGGETEEAITAELQAAGLISDDTVIVDRRPA